MRLNRIFLWAALVVIALSVLVWQIRDVDASAAKLRLEPIDLTRSGLAMFSDSHCESQEAVVNKEADTLVLCRTQTTSQVVVRWRAMASLPVDKVSMVGEAFRVPQNTTVAEHTFKMWRATKYLSTVLDATEVKSLFVHVVGNFERSTDVLGGWTFHGSEIQFSSDHNTIAYAFKFPEPCYGSLWFGSDTQGLLAFLRVDHP